MICVALAVAGCRSHEIVALQEVQEAVCACKDSACAEKAMADLPKADQKSTPRTQELARQILDCVAKIYEDEKAKKLAPDDQPITPPSDPSAAAGSGSGSAS